MNIFNRVHRQLMLLLTALIFSCLSKPGDQGSYPHLLVFDHDKREILKKIEDQPWAADIYREMLARIKPYVERHERDPEWILSRYQMNWDSGAHYVTHISDPSGTELIAWKGNAPFPTVRVTTHKRPPVTPDGYRYICPALEDIKPYGTDSLWYMQSSSPSGEWSWAEPRLFTGNVNGQINSLSLEAAIIYWLTGEKSYAKFSADLLFQWARGVYYQRPVEGAGRNGLLCIQSLGDRDYDNLVLAYDFVRSYMEASAYDTHYFQPVFEKLAHTTMLRGFVTNNWYAAQTTTLTYNALSLDDLAKQQYYLSFFLERDTVVGRFGQLALPSTIARHFTEDGHWKENAGYHDMPTGDLLKAAVPVEQNGYQVFDRYPTLYQASHALLRYSFPNLQIMGFGDIGRFKHQSAKNLEIAIRFAAQYAPDLVPGLKGSLNQLIDAGLYDRSSSGWYGLLTYLPEIPARDAHLFAWERAFELDYAGLYGQRNGTDEETGLMYYVQGATYNHNHANGMAMELYGRGYILGADPGCSASYEDSVFVHYLATFAAHNTVVAGGASEPSVPFFGSGGAKHMGKISLAAMEPAAGEAGVSPYTSFTETNYLEPSTQTQQQRLMGIVRTSDTSGYYVDFFRSDHPLSNDYLYHNVGHGVTLTDMARNPLAVQPDSIPYRAERQSGMDWFENLRTPTTSPSGAISTFRIEEQDQEEVFMQMLVPLKPGEKIYTALGPRTKTAPPGLRDLPTPATLIHRPESAWDKPFGVIYEPYRGPQDYTVVSVENRSFGASLTSLAVKHRDGSRQLIMQSDRPTKLQATDKTGLRGHYGVVSVGNEQDLRYLYLGQGQSIRWNGYRLESSAKNTAAWMEIQEGELHLSSSHAIRIRLPYRVGEVTDGHGAQLPVKTEGAGHASVIQFPSGMDQKYFISRVD